MNINYDDFLLDFDLFVLLGGKSSVLYFDVELPIFIYTSLSSHKHKFYIN